GGAASLLAPARLLPLVGAIAIAAGMHFGGMPGCGWYVPPVLYLVAVLAVGARLPGLAHATKTTQTNLERCHATVGRWLHDHAPEGASVGVDNIGYIG